MNFLADWKLIDVNETYNRIQPYMNFLVDLEQTSQRDIDAGNTRQPFMNFLVD